MEDINRLGEYQMFKTVGIYKNIVDIDKFEKYYVSEVIPRMLRLPGVIKMEVTSLFHASEQQAQGIDQAQLIIETHFESAETLKKLSSSPEGQEIAKFIINNQAGELASFVGREKSFYSLQYPVPPKQTL